MSTKKPSLFSQQMKSHKHPTPIPGPVIQEIREKTELELCELEKDSLLPILPQQIPLLPSSNPPTIPLTSYSDPKIHEENLKTIAQMSKTELENNLKEIQSILNPSTIEFLRKRGQQKLKPQPKPEIKDLAEDQIGDLQECANRTCMHISVFNSNFDKTRFDCEGNIAQVYTNGKWQGEFQGFTLREFANMIRSVLPQQRILAAEGLIVLIDLEFEERLQFLVDECEFAKTLVFGLSDKNKNVSLRIFELMKKVFKKGLEKNLRIQRKEELIFPAVESKNNFFLPKSVREQGNVWEEEEVRNFSEFFSEIGKDFVVDLISFGVLDMLTAYEVSDTSEILLGLSLHSVSACYALVRHKIFWSILQNVPFSYKILEILAKSSLPAAHKIATNLPQRFFSDLLFEDDSLGLLYSLFSHKQVFDIRTIAFERAQQGSSLILSAICRLVQSFPTNEYIGISELVYYKYLQEWRKYDPSLLSNSLALITSMLCANIKIDVDNDGVLKVATEIFAAVQFELNLEEFNGREKIVGLDLEVFFSADRLEGRDLETVKLMNACLRVMVRIMNGSNESSYTEIRDIVRRMKDRIIEQLKKVLKNLQYKQSVPKIVCYRLKELIYFVLLNFDLLKTVEKDDVLTIIPFLLPYDEIIFLDLLQKLFNPIPDFYKGYLNSDKNLSLSISHHEKSPKLASYFLSLNENPYFPLPFDWLFAPLPTSPPESIRFILQFLTTTTLSYPLSQIISDINNFFLRKDLEYILFIQELDPLLEKLATSPLFTSSINQVKNSVLNTTRDFIASSYLEKTYAKWILSFLQDGVEADIFKDTLDELSLLMSRILSEVQQEFYGGVSLYKKLFASI